VEHLLAHGGFDPMLGARPVRGAVQRLVEGPIAERILAGDLVPGDELEVAVESGAPAGSASADAAEGQRASFHSRYRARSRM
jgi:ATP-dependent Clp protease ATP-binding subunit ClpA